MSLVTSSNRVNLLCFHSKNLNHSMNNLGNSIMKRPEMSPQSPMKHKGYATPNEAIMLILNHVEV